MLTPSTHNNAHALQDDSAECWWVADSFQLHTLRLFPNDDLRRELRIPQYNGNGTSTPINPLSASRLSPRLDECSHKLIGAAGNLQVGDRFMA